MQYILENKIELFKHYQLAPFWNPEEFMLKMDVFFIQVFK